jgi:LacI family transcriptional regulator
MERWLTQLPQPVGILAANDELGVRLIKACGQLRLRIPDEVAVLGVDNDELICRASRPPLSSINMGADRIGQRAVQVLDDWFAGKAPPTEPITVPPLEVVTRVSTDTLAVDHPETAQAIRLIRERACQGLTVRQLLRHVPVARRTLEYQFKRRLQRTVHQEIRRVQLQRVRNLLVATDWDMPAIAAESGFEYPSQMSTLFKKHTGLTPTDFRRQHRNPGP